ncbi:FAD-dependent monooxygenase [Puia sp.]|jgi:2-polyprenyl-6-methoxyphenol hydroxylase-like FAD-dependent oxidoreductase|uniref:FAD-dependent monooxygenase n=1 Tax=Puia sp. TaxID=2045100 RepID=UPI002F422460
MQILIIGAGPTGLVLACELARRKVPVRIIDRAPEYPIGSRAKGLTPRSLEVMADLGVAEELVAAGSRDVIFRRYNRNEWLGDSRAPVFARPDARYVSGVLVPQWKVEEVLRRKLLSWGVEVERGTELIDFSQGEDRVVARLVTPAGEEAVNCAYLVGCDGGKSKVRKTLGIRFEGETHEEERAFIGDVEVAGLAPDAWYIWMHPTLGFGIGLCPFACSKSWQLQTMAQADADGQFSEPGLAMFRLLFAERAGLEGVTLEKVTWATVYRVNVRMANRFRSGRVFIAGDAAHVHSIAGGLGMNTGIQDAYNLGWKLAHVLSGEAAAPLLDTYEEERLPIAAWTLNISSERHRMVADAIKKGGDGGLHTVATKDTTQLNLNYRYSGLSSQLRDDPTGVQAGDRAPDGLLPDGSWLSDVYRGTHFSVIRLPAGGSAKGFGGDRVREFLLPDGLVPLFGRVGGIYVVRPDGYIGLVADAGDEAAVDGYLRLYLSHEITG